MFVRKDVEREREGQKESWCGGKKEWRKKKEISETKRRDSK